MSTQKMIEEQFKRLETLQKQFKNPKPDQEEVQLVHNLRTERAQTLRTSLISLERQRTETVARFDTEIASVTDCIAALEKLDGLDFSGQISGSGGLRASATSATNMPNPEATISPRKKADRDVTSRIFCV